MGEVGLCSHKAVDPKVIISVLQNAFVGSLFMCPSLSKIESQQYFSCFLFVWHGEGPVGSQKHCFSLFEDSALHCYLPGTLLSQIVRTQDFFLMKVYILQKLISKPQKTGMV